MVTKLLTVVLLCLLPIFTIQYNISENLPLQSSMDLNEVRIFGKYITKVLFTEAYWMNFQGELCKFREFCNIDYMEENLMKVLDFPVKNLGYDYYKYNSYEGVKPFIVIKRCNQFPPGRATNVNDTLQAMCENPDELPFDVSYYIHVSKYTNIITTAPIYANRYCAICNGIDLYYEFPMVFWCGNATFDLFGMYSKDELKTVLSKLISNCKRVIYLKYIKYPHDFPYSLEYQIFRNMAYFKSDPSSYRDEIIKSEKDLATQLCKYVEYQNLKFHKNLFCVISANLSLTNLVPMSYQKDGALLDTRDTILPNQYYPSMNYLLLNNSLSGRYFLQLREMLIIDICCLKIVENATENHNVINTITNELEDLNYCPIGYCYSTDKIFHPYIHKCFPKDSIITIRGKVRQTNLIADNEVLLLIINFLKETENVKKDFHLTTDVLSLYEEIKPKTFTRTPYFSMEEPFLNYSSLSFTVNLIGNEATVEFDIVTDDQLRIKTDLLEEIESKISAALKKAPLNKNKNVISISIVTYSKTVEMERMSFQNTTFDFFNGLVEHADKNVLHQSKNCKIEAFLIFSRQNKTDESILEHFAAVNTHIDYLAIDERNVLYMGLCQQRILMYADRFAPVEEKSEARALMTGLVLPWLAMLFNALMN